MAERYRDKRIEVQLTDEEKEIFQRKFEMSNSKSMAHFIYRDDIEDLKEQNIELSKEILKIQQILARNYIARTD